MVPGTQPETIRFGRDTTLRWPCRRGDFLLWLRLSDIFEWPDSLQVHDLWEMRDGYHVTITTRFEDIPPWFRLHPSEISELIEAKASAQKGQVHPAEPLDGPNLWRLRAGDRLAWVGNNRPEQPSFDGIFAVVDFHECALAVGEGCFTSAEDWVKFGCPAVPGEPQDLARCRAAVELVKGMGLPRVWSEDWCFG